MNAIRFDIEDISLTLTQAGLDPESTALGETIRRGGARSACAPLGYDTLERGALLGEGGTARVYAGRQRRFDREVAIKAAREDVEGAREIILQELWTLSQLDHPNIIPIYNLNDGPEGTELVMRRVRGVSWGALLEDPEAARARSDDGDVERFHLRVLMQVATAVHFAHSKAILHRDLKPDNVLVGQHGEVYLIDWGIAVTLDPARHPRLAAVDPGEGIVGTPLYLAPEMARREHESFSPRTDIFLLGAVLYRLLAGHPPHQSATLLGALIRSQRPPSPLPPEVAPDLVAICAKAMAIDPEARFESAEVMRRALAAHLKRQEAFKIAARARRDLEALRAEPAEARAARQRLFGACRFGFEQALAMWPEFEEARVGLEEARLEMARGAAHVGEHAAALHLIQELGTPTPRAHAEVRRLEAEMRRAREDEKRRAAIGSRYDAEHGSLARAALFTAAGVGWVIIPILHGLRPEPPPFINGLIGNTVTALGVLVVALHQRAWLWATFINRVIIAVILSGSFGLVGLDLICLHLGLDESVGYTLHLLIPALLAGVLGIAFDLRFAAAALCYTAMLGLALWHPPRVLVWTGLGNLALVSAALWAWWARRARRRSAEP